MFFWPHKHVIALRVGDRNHARGARSRMARFSQALTSMMEAASSAARALRAEARLLTSAGVILLGVGFPLTMALAWLAIGPNAAVTPVMPAAVGGVPLMLGYLACHFASQRMTRAKALESRA